MEKKSNSLGGFLALFVSTLIYALSGVVVVELIPAFGDMGQLAVRGLISLLLVSIWLLVSKRGIHLKNSYHKKWLTAYFACRPISNFLFILCILSLKDVLGDTASTATSAIFYLFVGRISMGYLIKALADFERKNLQMPYVKSFGIELNRVYGSFGLFALVLVLIGLAVYSGVAAITVGVLWGLGSGAVEAIKFRAMNQLNFREDKPRVAFYDFGILFLVSVLGVLLFRDAIFVVQEVSLTWDIFGMVLLAGLVGVGTLILDLYGYSNFDDDLGNIVQSSEIGFAGYLNYLIMSTAMTVNQIVGAVLLFLSMLVAGLAEWKRNHRK